MTIGLIGQKCGMTRIFTDAGESIPVTVIQIVANRIAQIKTKESDGYCAIQVAAGKQHAGRLNKARIGHLKKAGIEACRILGEFRVDAEELAELKVGDSLLAEQFAEGQTVDVRGMTRGKGFAGSVKRHNFSMQDATHGNSISHRHLGSTGQCQYPGRVFKGKKMAGQMGNVYRTARNQAVVRVDVERQLILVKGGVPGSPSQHVMITLSTKHKGEG